MIASPTKTLMLNQNDFDRLHALSVTPRHCVTHSSAILLLKELLDASTVVAPVDVPKDVVTMRSRVTLRDIGSRQSDEYTLVYPDESDIETGRVSVLAPLGLAMLGKRAGEVARFETPSGDRQVKIVRIDFQPESAGELHL